MRQKNLLTFTLILTVIFMLVAGTSYAQVKPIKKPIGVKTLKPILKTIKGTVFEINCQDNYIKVYDSNCYKNIVGINYSKCSSLNLSLYDIVRVIYRSKKRAGMRTYEMKGIKVEKVRRAFLRGEVKVVNCNDNYIDLEYNVCRRKIPVRVGISRNKCIRYNLHAGDMVKVYGKISYDHSHNRIVIRDVTNIVK